MHTRDLAGDRLMLLATPTLVRSKIAEVLKADATARVVALLASPAWPHDERVDLPGGRVAVVRPCVSSLAVRDALSSLDQLPPADVLVLLTELETTALGDSISARLAGQRVLPLDRWQHLMSAFRARAIDPRLTREPWAVDALLDLAPSDGYPAVRSGFLDRDTALGELAARSVGLRQIDLDLAGLLQWSLDADNVERWRNLDSSVRSGLTAWLTSRGSDGRVIDAVLRCMVGDFGIDTVSVGLALSALVSPSVRDDAKVPRTVLEMRAVGSALDVDVSSAWAQTADALVQRTIEAKDRPSIRRVIRRAEEILAEQNAVEFAHSSNILEASLVQRIVRVGEEINRCLRKRSLNPGHLRALEDALAAVEAHALSKAHDERVRRATMAVRLMRWVARERDEPTPPALDLVQAARRQQEVDAWVDVARTRVWEGDVDPRVSSAYSSLCGLVDDIRTKHEERFARLLADYARTGSTRKDLLPVEDVLSEIFQPLAQRRRVLLLVLDGMSTAVAREVLADLTARGWVEHGLDPVRPVISALPSITRVSRTSLLTGQLTDGSADTEQAAFAERGWLLFHSGDLRSAGAGDALPSKVLKAITGRSPVVGVVVNTVDDTLDKGTRTPWTPESIDRFLDLLTAAQDADRLVILVSDHGHVHERDSRLEVDDSGGARFRTSPHPVSHDEVELTGPRVLLGDGRVVAAWNEKLRYTKKHNGYHGGASAQEVVIPLALLARTSLELPGWRPRHHPQPDWWDASTYDLRSAAERPQVEAHPSITPAAPPAEDDGALFATSEVAPEGWIDRALAGEVIQDQLRRIRRGGMPPDRLAVLLRLLDTNGGVATRGAVARALDIPLGRVPGQIAAAQRVVNIDGYEVLTVEGDTIRLNATLLKTQVGLT